MTTVVPVSNSCHTYPLTVNDYLQNSKHRLLSTFKHQFFSFLCQKQVRNFKSWGRKAFIRFHANETNLGFGFLIRYMAVPKPNARELLTAFGARLLCLALTASMHSLQPTPVILPCLPRTAVMVD